MEAPPPTYPQTTDTICSFVDFSPTCLKSGIISSPQFERFDTLVERANAWLAGNPGMKVISCESSESLTEGNIADTNSSIISVSNSMRTPYNRSLRLWVCNKTPADSPEPQRLGYLNIVPGCTSPAGVFSNPKFQDFRETVEGFNAWLTQNPIRGRVINMETQNLVFKDWKGSVDPDSCDWTEDPDWDTYFLNIIRLFFEVGQQTVTRIGTLDFVPGRVTAGSTFSPGSFETFGANMTRANAWINQQAPNINVCNVQGIDYKVKDWKGDQLDTMRSFYKECHSFSTEYIKIIRVYWTESSEFAAVPNRIQLSYRTFMPVLLVRRTVGESVYQSQQETLKRAEAWVKATGAKVNSCETVKIRQSDGFQNGDPEVTFARDSTTMISRTFMMGLRLFLDGAYSDPPAEVLPPVPEATTECCVIL